MRAAGESKRADNNKIDIVDTERKLPINIQCKNTANTPSYFTIRESCSDRSKPFCLAWKKPPEEGGNSKGAIMMVDIDFFYTLFDAYTKLNNII